VRPNAAEAIALGVRQQFTFDPIGNQRVRAGETLTLQLSASGASPIVYRMFPAARFARLVTLDPNSGDFRFSPTADQVGQDIEITFQACVPEGGDCSAIVQAHETVHLTVESAGVACPNYVPPDCKELGADRPAKIQGVCLKITKAGVYDFGNVNILEEHCNNLNCKKGGLFIVEDPGKTIELRVNSMLVEKGGTLQAGSADCPFGKQGGKLSIGLYGDDLSQQATIPSPTPGIQCETAPGTTNRCFPDSRDFAPNKYYCRDSDTDDPCKNTTPPPTPPPPAPANTKNQLLEAYGTLNFDNTSWGYKVLG
jgi:hypothetical protein